MSKGKQEENEDEAREGNNRQRRADEGGKQNHDKHEARASEKMQEDGGKQ